MSTFGGLMEEYQSISIDRFDGANLDSSVFMLSHNHKDHTVGLSSTEFLYRLKNNPEFKLYCSPVTRDLLLLDDCLQAISKSIVPLEIDSPCVIDIPSTKSGKVEKTVTVTLLQAGHCPGSVMFLFEGDEGTVLYTGDFRLTKQDIASCLPLHSVDGNVKELKSLYADTTFCVPRAFFIPKREDSIDATIDLVREWISRSRAHIILLSYKANLGYEHMFMRLSEEFQMKIHVHDSKFEQYKKIGNLADFMTSDPAETQIHACKWHVGRRTDTRLPCAYRLVDDCLPIEVRTLALSTMCFVQTVGLESYTKRLNEHFFRVCYSFHSSYSEIRDMILYLKPDRVFPNVIPTYDDASSAQLQKRLNSFVKLAKKTHQSALDLNARDFGLLKSPKGKKRKHSSQQSHTSDSLRLIFDDDDKHTSSPARKVAKSDDHLHFSSKSDSKDVTFDNAHCEFPLLFSSQGCNGNSEVVSKSASSDAGAEEVQKSVRSAVYAGGDGLDMDEGSAITEEESDTDPEMENSAAFVLEPGSLVSYMSEDDSDAPTAPEPQSLITTEPQCLVAPEPQSLIAPEPQCLLAPEPQCLLASEPQCLLAPEPQCLTATEPQSLIAPEPQSLIAPEPHSLTAPELLPIFHVAPSSSTAPEVSPYVAPPLSEPRLPLPLAAESPSHPIACESQIEIPAKSDLESDLQKADAEISVLDEKVGVQLKDTLFTVSIKADVDSNFEKSNSELSVSVENVTTELKDAIIHNVHIDDIEYKAEGAEDTKPRKRESKSRLLTPSCAPTSNGVQTCVDISEETDLSDVIVVDDNSDNEAVDPVFVWLNGSNNSQMQTSQTIDSDLTVDVGASPYKRQQVPAANVSLSDVPAVSCECIDLSSDDSSLHSTSEFGKNSTAKVAEWCDKQMVERDHVAKNSEGDSLSDDYEGDDEFEETDKESGYDSDAEIISKRKCTYESVIKERALRFSRTAVNGSDVIVIDDDDVNDAGTSYMKEHHRFAQYSSTASSSSSSESSLSTGSPENFVENAPNCDDSGVPPQNSSNRVVFLHRSNKPRLWPRQLPSNTDGIKLSSSDDMFSS